MSSPTGIDPRGPRFAAWITSALLLTAVVLGLSGISAARFGSTGWLALVSAPIDFAFVGGSAGWLLPSSPFVLRALDPGFLLLTGVALLFLWGVLSPRTQPWSVLFRRAILPRLSPGTEREDPRPPRFAQGVGLSVVGIGLVLHLAGIPLALPIAAAAAFVAAFLNAAFGFCLGCQIYLLIQRAGATGRGRTV